MPEPLDAGIIDRLLGAPPGTPTWGVAEVATRARALATWLSAAAARGENLTGADLEYLARMRRRVSTLHQVAEELSVAHGLRVLKGPRIAVHYPAGLLRQSGDADFVAPDLTALWACALDLRARYDATPQSISVFDDADGHFHVGVSMKWPAEQPHLDKPMGADITTCAFCGDFKGVPVRVQPPEDDDLAGLFAVAEERFQRRYRLKDLLDFIVLAPALERSLGDALSDTVREFADRLALAPELRSLMRKAASWVPLTPAWQNVLDALAPLARAEKARRTPDRPGMHRLRFGLPLTTAPAEVGPDLEILHHDGLDLLPTPLGTCLLLAEPVLTDETWARADAIARDLAPASA